MSTEVFSRRKEIYKYGSTDKWTRGQKNNREKSTKPKVDSLKKIKMSKTDKLSVRLTKKKREEDSNYCNQKWKWGHYYRPWLEEILWTTAYWKFRKCIWNEQTPRDTNYQNWLKKK